jgi:hypothetical protein
MDIDVRLDGTLRIPAAGPLFGRQIGVSLTQGRYTGTKKLELVVGVVPQVAAFTPHGPYYLVFFLRDGGG